MAAQRGLFSLRHENQREKRTSSKRRRRTKDQRKRTSCVCELCSSLAFLVSFFFCRRPPARKKAKSNFPMWSLRPGAHETNGPITTASFIGHGSTPLILSGSYDGSVTIARAEPLPSSAPFVQKSALEGHVGPVFSAEWSPKNNTVVSAGSSGVIFWDANTAKMTNSFKDHTGQKKLIKSY